MIARTITLALLLNASLVVAQSLPQYCGEEGIWLQMLGSGDLDLDNNRSTASYIVWIDRSSVLLVDAGPGTALRFDQAGGKFDELDAIVLSQTTLVHTTDLPALLVGSYRSYRELPLTILGPTGDGSYPAASELLQRFFAKDGPYPSLAPLLSVRSPAGYQIRTRDVFAKGIRRWAQFGTERIELSAIPVHHGDTPALAWRVDIGSNSIVFALGLNNQKDIVTKFAKDSDAIVFTHALPVGTSGEATERFLLPRQIGRISGNADVRFIVMGGRGWRTIGRENRTLDEIRKSYDGTIIFPDDLECWGL